MKTTTQQWMLALGLSLAATGTFIACSDPPMTPAPSFPGYQPHPTSSASASGSASADALALDNRPKLRAPTAFTPPTPEVTKLSNGMSAWILERHALPLVSVTFSIPVGSAADPKGKAGLASLTADMLDEGAGARSAVLVSTALQDLGTSLRTTVTQDGTVFSMTVLKRNFAQAFSIVADVIARPSLDPKEFKRVKDLWKNALLQRSDDPGAVASAVSRIAVFGPDHPYGHPADGLLSHTAAVDLESVKAFYAAHYRPSNITITVAGDLSKDELNKSVNDVLGAWQPAAAAAPEPLAMPATPYKAPRMILVDRPDAPQSVVSVVKPGIKPTDADAPLYDLVNTALGGSFTSRLNQNLREDKNWTYGARSAFTESKNGGLFLARAAVETKHTGDAMGEILKELTGMAKDGLTAEEVDKVRSQDRADLVSGYETVESVSGRFASLSFLGLPSSFDTEASTKRQKAGGDALKKIAESVDPTSAILIIVGPASEVTPMLAPWGTPTLWDPEGNPPSPKKPAKKKK